MTIFYRSRELVISRDAFVTLLSRERFALADLRDVHVVREGLGGLARIVRRPRLHLRASYDGAPLALYSTTDERAFGEIRRALVRALEANQAAYQH